MSKKKFFSGNSVRQALLAAAAHFDLPAEQIAYREVEKKHGFLKAKKRAVIEVDAENPRQSPTPTQAASATDGEAAREAVTAPPSAPESRRAPRARRDSTDEEADEATVGKATDPAPATEEDATAPARRRRPRAAAPVAPQEHEPEDEDEGGGDDEGRGDELPVAADDEEDRPQRPVRGQRDWRDEEEDEDEDDDEGDDDDEDDEDGEGDEDDEDGEGTDDDEDEPVAPSPRAVSPDEGESVSGRRRRRRRRGGRGRGAAVDTTDAQPDEGSADLVTLPEHSRRPADRYAEAHGPLADACRQALDRVLDVAGLDLSYTVLQGEDRLEIDLTGRDEALLVAEGGELLRAVEHLVPRVVRSIAGEPVSVRVDSADFHEIHEEQLRSLAQRVASEVRRSERPRTLEPMSPADRRIVHITLADEPRVTSMSEGSGYFKRIVVKPN